VAWLIRRRRILTPGRDDDQRPWTRGKALMTETIFAFLSIDSWVEFWWVVLGLTAQLAFSARFIVQWIASERAGRSYVPVAFWYLSILGGTMLLSYAIYRQDVVFILGQSMGLIVYVRNLVLIRRARKADKIAAAHGPRRRSGRGRRRPSPPRPRGGIVRWPRPQ
jgi:lipid-A-disaccharide synthase-like uncharacterized protein